MLIHLRQVIYANYSPQLQLQLRLRLQLQLQLKVEKEKGEVQLASFPSPSALQHFYCFHVL